MRRIFPVLICLIILSLPLAGCGGGFSGIKFYNVSGREIGAAGTRADGIEITEIRLYYTHGGGSATSTMASAKLFAGGVAQPDPVYLTQDYSGPGETDCFNADPEGPTLQMGVYPTDGGHCGIFADAGIHTGKLPVIIYDQIIVTRIDNNTGMIVSAEGHSFTVERAASTVYLEWRANGWDQWQLRIIPKSYFISGVPIFAAIKTVDPELMAAGIAEQWLDHDQIYIIQLPGGYLKAIQQSNTASLMWEFSSTGEFL